MKVEAITCVRVSSRSLVCANTMYGANCEAYVFDDRLLVGPKLRIPMEFQCKHAVYVGSGKSAMVYCNHEDAEILMKLEEL